MDYIYDYEVAALQAILAAVDQSSRVKLLAQLQRYDRIDRSEDGSKQRLIDDDSDFRRSDWPNEILFADEGLVHSGNVALEHAVVRSATVKAKAFFVCGRFDGCEFNRHHSSRVDRGQYAVAEAMSALEAISTNWMTARVSLFTPLGAERSTYTFVPA